jgi:tRNA-specific 2-thiouridylase
MKIAVAMSGGVDSSVAALLLSRAGHDLVGLTMLLGDVPGPAQDGAGRAALVAASLGIPHRVIDAGAAFEDAVISDFASEYARGRTPNPCILCNRFVKFGLLLDEARALGAERLATGHYAAIRSGAPGEALRLASGRDTLKDQSYFLYSLTQAQLGSTLFPLGDMAKDEVRRIASSEGLGAGMERESADACFVPRGDLAAFLAARAPRAVVPGPIVDASGRRVGTHKGLALYTVGQRSGLGISAAAALYVVRIVADENTIVVGEDRELHTRLLTAGALSWIAGGPPSSRFSAHAKVRYGAPKAACVATVQGDEAAVLFDAPQRAIAPGQAVVLYAGDEVLGGGVIAPVA